MGKQDFFFLKGCKDRLSKFLNYVVKLVAKTKGLWKCKLKRERITAEP